MAIPTDQLLKVCLNELYLWRRAVAIAFLAIITIAVIVGLAWPKTYTGTTTIFVEETNIIQPLMEGAAHATGVADRARLAREVIFGRKVMAHLAEDIGWIDKNTSERERERAIRALQGGTSVVNAGRGLIRIEFTDATPEAAYRATKRIAELFIMESHQNKLEESRAAYDFITQQVQEYHDRLLQAEQQLKQVRSSIIEVGAGSSGADVVGRLNQIRQRIDQAQQELREAHIRKESLERQLSGEAEMALVLSREGQYQTRISELQTQLAALRLNFHDAHPDIIRIRHQIDDLQEAVKNEQLRREQRRAAAPSGQPPGMSTDEAVIHSPVYQQLRGNITQAKTQIDTLSARVAESKQQLQNELQKGKEVTSSEARIAEVTRDYQVNNTIYQDLLRRRESALVSMNLDRERQGLRFKIQEDAVLPLNANGLRLIHILMIGLALSVFLPLGAIVALVMVDPRIRSVSTIVDSLKTPVLGSVPHLWTPRDAAVLVSEMGHFVVLGLVTLTVLVIAGALRVTGVW